MERLETEWSGVRKCSDEMIYFSIFGMETSLGKWPTQGKLTPVIVSSFYEPLDSLAVSNFYKIFTIRTRTEYWQDTSVCNFQKKWVIFTPLWFRITNYSSHCGELYFLTFHIQDRLLLKSKLSRNLAHFQGAEIGWTGWVSKWTPRKGSSWSDFTRSSWHGLFCVYQD